MENKITFNDYKKTYLNFASVYGIEGPLSLETINTIMYYMNSEFMDNDALNKILDMDYICQDNLTTDYIAKAIEEIKNYNTNSYYKQQESIKLSDAVIMEEHKQVIKYIEDLVLKIRELPQDEAINSYIELKDIITHKSMKEYDELTFKQQKLIESIDLPVATNLFDYRKNAKQYKIVA